MSIDATEQPLLSHLNELRTRLLRIVLAIAVVATPLLFFSNQIYQWVALPLIRRMPDGASMIATDVASPFLTPLKLTLIVAAFLAVPFILNQIWRFIAPGLYQHEKRMVIPLLVASTLLFYFGIAFAYFVVFPLAFGFFVSAAPEGVSIATDINSYLNFVLKLFFAFGIAFEIPVAIVLMCTAGVIDASKLSEKRPYVIVSLFVIGMLLTPPDVISQTLLAVPMWLLYEVGSVLGVRIQRKQKAKQRQEEQELGLGD